MRRGETGGENSSTIRSKDQRIHIVTFCSQIPHHEGHIVAVPRDTARARGRSDEDGSEGGAEVEFQAVVARPEDRGARADAAEHRRRPVDMPEGQGEVQGFGERDRLEDQAYGRHERDAAVRRDRSAGDGHEEEVDEAADLDELRGAVRAVRLQSALLESIRVQAELLRPRRH